VVQAQVGQPGEVDGTDSGQDVGQDALLTVDTWLKNHPRFYMHYTPTYSSWINDRTLVRRTDPPTAATRRPPQRARPGKTHLRLGQRLQRKPKTVRMEQNRRADFRITRTINKTN
jgi:hypothetical protein